MQQQKKEKKERTGMSCELNETINNDKNGRNSPTLGYGMIKSPVKDFIKTGVTNYRHRLYINSYNEYDLLEMDRNTLK